MFARPILNRSVVVIVAAHNEEAQLARRIENLLALDYPSDCLEIVVSSDSSTDRTEEIALQYPEVKVVTNPRGGKVAAQDRAVRSTESELVAFSETPTRPGRRMRCAGWSGPSRIRASRMPPAS